MSLDVLQAQTGKAGDRPVATVLIMHGLGADGRDFLYGGFSEDILKGGAGIDDLYGGPGSDSLRGGAGADNLVGGGAAVDFFVFGNAAEVENDEIYDFGTNDLIHLRAFMQNGQFVGYTGFRGNVGDVRAVKDGQDSVLKGDVDGDGNADWAMFVIDSGVMRASDFIF